MKACILLVVLFLASNEADSGCKPTSKHFYKHFSTKTPYQYIVDQLEPEENDETCQDLQVWSIVRHGTRYPSKQAIKYMNQDILELRDKIAQSSTSELCKEDKERLIQWKSSIELDQSKDLHPEGEEELILMGERMLDKFGSLLNDYHETDFIFRATDTQRAVASGKHFAIGLFSRPVANKVKYEVPIKPHDPLLRFYKLCKKWLRDVKKNPESRNEFVKFSESSHLQEIRRNLSTVLGLQDELSIEDLDKIYVSCNFDQAWRPRTLSPWCSLFTDKALEIMEYREDLEYYWIDGPGHEISGAPACVLMENVLLNFKNVTSGAPEERGIFYFTHSGTLLKFLAFLGTHQDTQHLYSHNFNQMKNRKWRTSKIGPFAGNILFLLRKCSNTFSVCLYVNEKLENVPGCDGSCCPWDRFVQLFQSRVDSCDLDNICQNTADTDTYAAPDDRY